MLTDDDLYATAEELGTFVREIVSRYYDNQTVLAQAQAVERAAKQLVDKAREVNGVKVVTAVLPMNPAAAKDLAFKIRAAVDSSLLCVLGTHDNNKPQLSIMMSDDMVSDHGLNAGQMVREAAKLIQGGGGGQPHFAQAGGKNADGLSAAVDKVLELAKL